MNEDKSSGSDFCHALPCAYCTMYDCGKNTRYELGQVSDEQILQQH